MILAATSWPWIKLNFWNLLPIFNTLSFIFQKIIKIIWLVCKLQEELYEPGFLFFGTLSDLYDENEICDTFHIVYLQDTLFILLELIRLLCNCRRRFKNHIFVYGLTSFYGTFWFRNEMKLPTNWITWLRNNHNPRDYLAIAKSGQSSYGNKEVWISNLATI